MPSRQLPARDVTPLEALLVVFAVAVGVAALARRVGVPYPTFLAIGGALLAFVPGFPTIAIEPDMVLALFVAPILLDAAHKTSLRDLKINRAPVLSLVLVAVGVTTVAVAIVVRTLVPGMPWAAAIALGALLAPPDAVSAMAILRNLRPPRRVSMILEGESLLNDASALIIYRLAVSAVAVGGFSLWGVAPAFLLSVGGAILLGPALGWLAVRTLARIGHVESVIILQFVSTYAVWVIADRLQISPVLTVVLYGFVIGRHAPARTPVAARVSSNAVWEAAVFALDVLAFVFIGMQLRPVVAGMSAGSLAGELATAGAVLLTVILVRFAWVVTHYAFHAAARRRSGRDMTGATLGSAVLISWSGMRGIVTLAAALALPADFPFRSTILLSAFVVVLGTLLLQGLTLGPLIRVLGLAQDDSVEREIELARGEALAAALGPLQGTAEEESVRREFAARLQRSPSATEAAGASASQAARVDAIRRARSALQVLRERGTIGDDTFHLVQDDIDRLEMAGTPRARGW